MNQATPDPLYLDIEVAPDKSLLCMGFAVGDGPLVLTPDVSPAVRMRLQDPKQVVVTHSKFDLRHLILHEGLVVKAQLHDTMVMGWLVNETTKLTLDDLARRYLAVEMDKRISGNGKLFTTDTGKKVPLEKAPWDQLSDYCGRDVGALRALYKALTELLRREGLLDYFLDTEAPFTEVLLEMECRGIPIDLTQVDLLRTRLAVERDGLATNLTWGLPTAFNLRSPEQVCQYLGTDVFTIKGRLPKTEELEDLYLLRELQGSNAIEDKPGDFIPEKVGRLWVQGTWVVQGRNLNAKTPLKSVNKDELLMSPVWHDGWVQDYLRWKKLDKLIGTWLDTFPEVAVKGRIYGRFNQTGTVTGRLSSSEPNLQNIPARGQLGSDLRTCFAGNLVVGDFAQLEPRLMAHFSQDPELLDTFMAGDDLYQRLGQGVGCDRATAKVLTLAMGYGAGPDKVWLLLRKAGLQHSKADASLLLNEMKALYGDYFRWRERTIQHARNHGWVETLDGRKRRINVLGTGGPKVGWKEAAAGDRQAANAVIQGSAADVVRRVMLRVNALFPQLHLLGQVHDELLFEYDPQTYTPDLARLQHWVESVANTGLTVPLVFEPHRGANWHEAKP